MKSVKLIIFQMFSKWKPISHSSKMGSVYQVVKLESFSIYCNVNCAEILINNENMTSSPNNNWVNCMKRSLETFSIFGETFDFSKYVKFY